MSASRRLYEQRMVTRRDQEDRIENLSRYVSSHHTMKANARSEPRVEAIRRHRTQAEIRSDIRKDAEMQQAHADAVTAAKSRMEEERLARAIDVVKRQDLRREKDIQRIREESDELRSLESMLKAAYMNKEREAQIAEKLASRAELGSKEQMMDSAIEVEREKAVAALQATDMERRKHATSARVYLEEQMEEKEELKVVAQAQFEREKAMIDAIVGKIAQQDEEEDMSRRTKQLETQRYIKQYLRDKEQWKIDAAREAEEEAARIDAYATEKRAQMDAWEASKEAAQFERDQIAERIAAEQGEKLKQLEYMEQLRCDLVLQEREEEMRKAEEAAFERRVQERKDMMAANAQQQQLKASRAAAMRKEEDMYRQMMLEKLAEDDKVEQMNAQKRRMKQQDHRREVERLIEARRAEYEARKEAAEAEKAREKELESAKQEIIDAERRKMIAEHAVKLHGYLPTGVIMDDKDLQLFPPEVRQQVKDAMLDRQDAPNFGIKREVDSYTIY